jgi:folate-dependent tRNA-U54 methylase TrmFO/GidA
LAVDREEFSKKITEELKKHPNIEVIAEDAINPLDIFL